MTRILLHLFAKRQVKIPLFADGIKKTVKVFRDLNYILRRKES